MAKKQSKKLTVKKSTNKKYSKHGIRRITKAEDLFTKKDINKIVEYAMKNRDN